MKHGSLFSGIGGIDLGFEMAGIQTAWTCEIDDFCHELLSKRFPLATHYTDIKEIGSHNLESVDVISGGFPCQDISTAGKGAGLEGERSGLWFEMWRVIGELQPRWVFIENVANLTTKGGARVLHDLAEIGYDAEWQIISARDVGARHLRKRIWIIAYPQNTSEKFDIIRNNVSNSECEGFQGSNISSNMQNRNKVGNKQPTESSLQKRSSKLSNSKDIPGWNRFQETCRTEGGKSKLLQSKNATSSTENEDGLIRGKDKLSNSKSSGHRRSSGKECGTKREGLVQPKEQKGSKVGSKTKGCSSVSSQTTTKRRADKGVEGQDRTLREFKLKTFKILENEPGLDRVAYGLSEKVDKYNSRVKGLGNAVVPQIPFLIGKRLMELNKIMEEKDGR
tara:strand:+ start:1511 stop:2689 length:1179 start_codon:yes stop_codon:yes gene_type:complete